jgi:methionine-rich copper-binding protein CopC
MLAVAAGASLSAHMTFQKAAPASDSTVATPPAAIQIWFSEPPDAKVSKLELKGPSGVVPLTGLHVMDGSLMASVNGTLADGVYTVSWQAAGKDGHLQKGDYKFTLKRAR